MATGFRLQATGARRRWRRLALGLLIVAALGWALSQASRLPGPVGAAVRANLTADRDATALFYTEVDGWRDRRAP